MANTAQQVPSIDEEVPNSSSDVASDNDVLKKLLRDTVRTLLPPQPIKDLLSHGVCPRCIFRIFGLQEIICSHPSVTTQMLRAILCELTSNEGDAANNCSQEIDSLNNSASVEELKEEVKACCVCLGILQFVYNDDKGMLLHKGSANDFAAAIGDVVKKEVHQIDGFSLEVSLPPLVVENEQAIWSYMKKKYSSESWFVEKFPSEHIGTKDFLKLSVTDLLERLLDVKVNGNSFRIRLTYTLSDSSTKNHQIKDSNGSYKRRKIDVSNDFKKSDKVEGRDSPRNSLKECEDSGTELLKFHLPKAGPCTLFCQCYRTSIYIGGRYLKYSRNVSQTRWIIDDERMGESSIEEIVGGNILPICQGDTYKFHAAGREDIDVRMLGTGRPFLVELQNARVFPSDDLVKEMEMKINSLEKKFVRVKNLKVLGNQVWELMREGEAEKQKQYAALVWVSRPLDSEDVHTLSSLKDMLIIQKTPIRVLHRRSPLEREKTIHWMKVEKIADSSQYFLLHLCTQAGTYIKEFVHGDLGRTHPSVGSILKCRAEILQLDVTDVKMDCFQA